MKGFWLRGRLPNGPATAIISVMTPHTTNSTTVARWIAGFVMVAGLGTAIFAGGAVASADTGTTTVGPAAGASTPGVSDGNQAARRRMSFDGAHITEVKMADLDANSNK